MFAAAWFRRTPTDYTFHTTTELVLVNVTVRDRNGNPVRDLKREDFTVLEDNKPQQVISFDLENTDAVLSTAATEAPLLGKPRAQPQTAPHDTLATRPLKDRRLIILFFDLSSMQPDEIDRATTAAQNYVEKQMVAADLVSVVSLGNTLSVNQDFTSDRALLKTALQASTSAPAEDLRKAAPARPKARPKPADRSLSTTPSTTSSTPTGGCRRCARSRTSFPISRKRNRSFIFPAAWIAPALKTSHSCVPRPTPR